MGDKFDPYREALVVEKKTIWPDEFAGLDLQERKQIEERLHADAKQANEMAYVRLHTGFCRQITVTAEDIQQVK